MEEILDRILAAKRDEISAAKTREPLEALRERLAEMPAPRDFLGAIRGKHAAGMPAVIAEIKRASPSKGVFRHDFGPGLFAKSYSEHGAACLSVLTDGPFFGGSAADLKAARSACDLPVLRKDFMIDPYQVYEARMMGADCILLIAGAIALSLMHELEDLALSLGLAVLVESHNASELRDALQLKTPLIGINNRNLKTFVTDLAVTERLRSKVSDDRILVTESGISARRDVVRMQKSGVSTYLVGGVLMESPDPGKALEDLFFMRDRR
jgi:indole-3-glycerol phosphate synthase